ncbi:sensor histidine kinase [Streptomyces brasiliensis]|uniref:histidine kinase n=1 Tax=Streptomyces brasiliensis TaxID=1954 RepID=A0A917PBY3_9ACTN|nr:sensor histidine kinase [Streptomyces brasiliensis]GGJ69964.1 two-component sensor histidine kinase [Streptomyces brasiliensis]
MKRLQGSARAVWPALRQVLAGPDPAPAWRPRSQQERRAAYVALAAATLVLCLVNATHVNQVAADGGQAPAGVWLVTLALVTVLPLLLVATYPMAAWRTGWLALLLSPLLPAAWWGGWPWGPPQVLALLVAFCLAAVRQRRAALWWMWALTLIPWCAWLIRDIPNLHGPASATIVFTAAAIAVDSVGSRLRTQRALVTQTVRTDTERSRRAVLEERTRIARELHDVVAHHLSLIAVQAETAPYRVAELPEPVRAEFGALSEVAREALMEMRRLLGVLRQDQPAGLAPQPRLTDLPALVDSARRAGVEVALSVPVELDTVPAGVGICVYRIVQESLSNASRHAPGAAVTVSVDQDARAVQLRVANGPGGPVAPSGHERERGHGLTGMRERVALLGGSLSAGPTPAGGFEVSVVLPLGGTP